MRWLYTEKNWGAIELAELFGVSDKTVGHIINGRTWKSITGGINISRYGRNTEFNCSYISERLEQGCTNYQTIANELGITRQAVGQLIRTKNLGDVTC